MIPEGHLAHLFLNKGNFLFLRNMVCMMSAVGVLVGTQHSKLDRDILDKGIKFYDTAAPIVFQELPNAGLPFLHGGISLGGRYGDENSSRKAG